MATYWLSSHLNYRCQQAGACCSSGWPIPLEASRVPAVQEAVRDGRIPVADPWLVPVADVRSSKFKSSELESPELEAGLVAIGSHGHCVFHQHDRCTIHGALGHDALPSACQHFPRICLIDPRGVFVTLSHFCPTAASLLFDSGPVSIVEGPPALPGGVEPEGLDAREAWPPLLEDGVLMDLEGYGRWERHMVKVLAGEEAEASPESALARLRADAESPMTRTYAPGGSEDPPLPLVGRAPEVVRLPLVVRSLILRRFDLVRGTVPMPLTWSNVPNDFEHGWTTRVQPTWSAWAPVVQRFLAAHAFGSWVAYQGRGLRSIVRGLEAALAVLQVEVVRACQARRTALNRESLHGAIRQADLLLRHYADRQAFADAVSIARRQ